MAEQRQQMSNISEDRNQARRERDRTRRNSLTTEQKEEINARRRANDRVKRNSLTAEQKKEINARKRASEQRTSIQRITEENRARRRTNAARRRNTPCTESIADRKSTRLNSSHITRSRMPSSA